MTSAPPDKPGYDKSKKWSNRDPQPLRRRGSRLWDPTGRLATDMEFCARGVVAHISPKRTSGPVAPRPEQFPSGASLARYCGSVSTCAYRDYASTWIGGVWRVYW